jgi:hypothetical protein
MMPDDPNTVGPNALIKSSLRTIQKWGGLASFLLPVVFIVPELIYLAGNLRDAFGPLGYTLADFLYGPVKAACLVMAGYALTEYIGKHAPRQISLARWAVILSAGMFVLTAIFRSTNRQYHLSHPDLHLEMDTTVLVVWGTLVSGIIAAGWHFLGWSMRLLGSAGWTSGRSPKVLSILYLVVGTAALFLYLLPSIEAIIVLLGMVVSIWQGILLWRTEAAEMQAPLIDAV